MKQHTGATRAEARAAKIEVMRACLWVAALAGAALWAVDAPGGATVSGKLIVHPAGPAVVETQDHRQIVLEGDESTSKVLADQRLNGFEVEARGRFTSPDHFLIDPFYTHGLMARKDGKLKLISYYCSVCNIRSYTPGPCVCCQRETTLELRDPNQH
jgi:hypothetical protein